MYAIKNMVANREPSQSREALHRRARSRWYLAPPVGRLRAHRAVHARTLIALCAGAAVAGCGAPAKQDAKEPKGRFPVEVLSASFPSQQGLATTSDMVITVHNPGPMRIPIISVTVKCPGVSEGGSGGSASGIGGAGGGFAYRSSQQGVADPARPRFVVNRIPTRTARNYDRGRLDPLERTSNFVDTFPLGPLDAGRTVTFRWNVTAVHTGPFKVCYRVNAGLYGKAVAVPVSSGEPIAGAFTGTVAAKPPQAHIGPDGHTVVESPAQSGSSP